MIDRPDLLYLVHRAPYPPDKGDRIRNFNILKFLSERARVHLACLADEPVSDDIIQALEQYCERLAVVRLKPGLRWVHAASSVIRGGTVSEGAFASRELSATLSAWVKQTHFRSVLVSASSLVPYLAASELSDVPAVVDLIDVDSQKWLDYAAVTRGPARWVYRMEGVRLRRLEASLAKRVKALAVVSEAEASLFRQFQSEGSIHAIPSGVDLEYFSPARTLETENPSLTDAAKQSPDCCVFVGALDYRPNVDAACWFCTEIWPAILRRRPGAKVRLVGRRPARAVRRLAGLPGVELVGQVPDVRPYLACSSIVIAPLRLARGIQTKVLEALAMGKAVVASPESLKAIAVTVGKHLLAAETPDQWVEAIDRLFRNSSLREQLGAAGRQFVETQHDWDRCLQPFAALLGLDDAPSAANCKTRESTTKRSALCSSSVVSV
jgi:sugar transferase (PEP-CTERM/EpsH1 system associated)